MKKRLLSLALASVFSVSLAVVGLSAGEEKPVYTQLLDDFKFAADKKIEDSASPARNLNATGNEIYWYHMKGVQLAQDKKTGLNIKFSKGDVPTWYAEGSYIKANSEYKYFVIRIKGATGGEEKNLTLNPEAAFAKKGDHPDWVKNGAGVPFSKLIATAPDGKESNVKITTDFQTFYINIKDNELSVPHSPGIFEANAAKGEAAGDGKKHASWRATHFNALDALDVTIESMGFANDFNKAVDPDITHTVDLSAASNGTVTADQKFESGKATLPENTTITFTAKPKKGYVVDSWKVDGKVVASGSNTFNIANLEKDTKVEVTFKPLKYKVVFVAGEGALIKGKASLGVENLTYGKKVGKTVATPKKAGYKFKGWYTKAKKGTKIAATSKKLKSTVLKVLPADGKAFVNVYAQWTKIKKK